ncbi:hypothetical protein PHYBOEH_011122 [Phytophthora boehmeriae]|uniref:EF-hand domain-containing protein n=1 Tax=Phytophthora boehmeriae TaxID=109152 RepID=A0A8T1X441_9STRA|nr:hypothetical protein PHYBOEH_011122 [Phytophthora boehmeriae]
MGLFGRKGRVAEGGGGTLGVTSDAANGDAKTGKSGGGRSLELFGADSDESDDEATIERYAKDGDEEMDEKEAAEAEKRKVAVLNAKLPPEELFKKYDTDGSGNISASEFLAMLPDLGLSMSAAKAMRIFRKCDTDGGGEIDLAEFKMAMFAVDPVSGNTLGFSPSTLLGPRDAFELFDEDGTGQIDELEFADVLEYFGLDVSDGKQEKIFKKYDKDKSGYIDYNEFRSMWISLIDVREELTKRGVEVPKHSRQSKLQQMLESIIDEEEAREAVALEEAKRFLQRQRDKEFREMLGRKAVVRAEDELAAALDAAGQVYIIGSGKYDQFTGEPVVRDEDLFPGFKAVSDIWSCRVNPTIKEPQTKKPRKSIAKHEPAKEETNNKAPEVPKGELATEKPKATKTLDRLPKNELGAPASKYVRRRVENKRWKFQGPPKLNRQTISQTKALIRTIKREAQANEYSEGNQHSESSTPTEVSEIMEFLPDEDIQNEEVLAKLFFEDREFVRSLRFRSTKLMTNTGPLWGRSVAEGSISDNVAFAVTSSGNVFSWGGRNSTWEASAQRLAGYDSDSDGELGLSTADESADNNVQSKVTPRSALQKMCTPGQLKGVRDPDVEAREEEQLEIEARQNEETLRYERLKRVVMYYDVWEPPPSNTTRLLFMEQVLLPKVEYEQLMTSSQLRGLEFDYITKMDISLELGECFELEIEVKGEAGHAAFKESERLIKEYSLDKKSKLLQPQNDQGVVCFDVNHPQCIEAFDGLNMRQVSCSFSHSAAIDSDGALYTWGSACNGKLGVGIVEDEYKQYSLTPLLVKFPGKRKIRSVSCGASHSGAVSTASELFMWGSANGGRLGLGPNVVDTIVVPTLVRELVKKEIRVWQISCGTAHSAICTEVTSEYSSGSKKLLGGQVYVCGGATPLGRYMLTWELVQDLNGVAVRQVVCGGSHTAAVSSHGELYTWGRNYHGCTGHDVNRAFVEKPELLKCLHVEAYNLAVGKPCRQISVYNEQGPHLAMEDKPWWEVDLGQPAVIERIRLWNRTDEPLDPSKRRSEYSSRLYPCWILVSEFAFKDLEGKEGLRAAKVQSSAFELFQNNQRMTEWVLPTSNTVGQFVRVQLQNRNFLHFAELEVFGVYSAFKYVGRVGSVQCSADATLVIMPPIATQSILDEFYLRAIQADADHATILRQYDAYERSFRKFGRGSPDILDGPCRLCRVFRDCEVCEFYASANYSRLSSGSSDQKTLPLRLVGDRMGLKELVSVALAASTLEADQQDRALQEQEAAERVRKAQEDVEIEAERQRVEESERSKRQTRLLKPFQGLNFLTKKT